MEECTTVVVCIFYGAFKLYTIRKAKKEARRYHNSVMWPQLYLCVHAHFGSTNVCALVNVYILYIYTALEYLFNPHFTVLPLISIRLKNNTCFLRKSPLLNMTLSVFFNKKFIILINIIIFGI